MIWKDISAVSGHFFGVREMDKVRERGKEQAREETYGEGSGREIKREGGNWNQS